MRSIYILYIQCPSEHFIDNRYFRCVDFSGLVGLLDVEVPGFIPYAICPPDVFKSLSSAPGCSFIPLEVE